MPVFLFILGIACPLFFIFTIPPSTIRAWFVPTGETIAVNYCENREQHTTCPRLAHGLARFGLGHRAYPRATREKIRSFSSPTTPRYTGEVVTGIPVSIGYS